MAYVDYQHCTLCDIKAFYDAGIDWEYQRAKKILTLCAPCAAKWDIQVVNKETGEIRKDVGWENLANEKLEDK